MKLLTNMNGPGNTTWLHVFICTIYEKKKEKWQTDKNEDENTEVENWTLYKMDIGTFISLCRWVTMLFNWE